MNRDEYMRLKGELVTAGEQLGQLRSDKRKTQDALQGWTNRLQEHKLNEEGVAEGHVLIDQFYTLQQREAEASTQEDHYRRALAGQVIPAP